MRRRSSHRTRSSVSGLYWHPCSHLLHSPRFCKNQDDFPLLVATLLGSFIGYDPQQVGSAIIYFRMAMRTETGAIQHDQYIYAPLLNMRSLTPGPFRYTVGLSDDDDSFDVFAGGPKQDEIDRWANYVDAVLRTSLSLPGSSCLNVFAQPRIQSNVMNGSHMVQMVCRSCLRMMMSGPSLRLGLPWKRGFRPCGVRTATASRSWCQR